MKLDFNPVEQILNLANLLVKIDAPAWYINPDFSFLFRDEERNNLNSISNTCNLELDKSLGAVLQSSSPPSIEYFEGLSPPYRTSETEGGLISRTKHYKPNDPKMPRHVKLKMDQGYDIASVGLLCSSPIPPPGLQARAIGLFLLLEAVFCTIFHGKFEMITDQYYEHILLWQRDDVSWLPLCSHLSLKQHVRGDLSLTPEELEIQAAIREARDKQRRNENNRNWREREKTKDPIAYKARMYEGHAARYEKIEDEKRAYDRTRRAEAKDERRFLCEDCDIPLSSQYKLTKHLDSQSHRDTVAGIEKPAPHRTTSWQKERRESNCPRYLGLQALPLEQTFHQQSDISSPPQTASHKKKEAQNLA
ncbi:hypothetical protein LTR84_004219 [Exophiala bonariae]|uniref:C2H2-type domain-containing protein n=1 Tax=Exophiala bonariae TaxID=1690606 RepID=A0AAV9N9R7_9EURO|nr:hypothetical protein LTR84_004219 [Exophiala bonariae]